MRYKLLGQTGLKVSELCFGAMSFGDQWGYGSNEEESKACFDAFVNAGGNFFDTADNYTMGNSERLLGQFIKGNRERYVIATKCTLCGPTGPSYPGDPNATGTNRKHQREALHHSLERLDTDYVDVLYVHGWDFTVKPAELMATLNDFVREGTVSYLGVSNTPAYIVAECNAIANARGWEPFSVYEGQYNLIRRTAEIEILPAVEHFGMSMTVWQPLAGAMLCGSEDELNRRIAAGYPKPNEAQMKIIRAVNEVAEETGRSVPQVALNWLRQQSPAIIPIIGVRLPEHVIDNVACLDWTLTEDQIDRLNAAQTLTTIYPYDQLTASINYFIYNFMPKQAFDTHRFPRWIK